MQAMFSYMWPSTPTYKLLCGILWLLHSKRKYKKNNSVNTLFVQFINFIWQFCQQTLFAIYSKHIQGGATLYDAVCEFISSYPVK